MIKGEKKINMIFELRLSQFKSMDLYEQTMIISYCLRFLKNPKNRLIADGKDLKSKKELLSWQNNNKICYSPN